MAIKIKHKFSSVSGNVPTAGQLDPREIAINTADGKAFVKKDDGTIVDLTLQVFKNDTSVAVSDTGSNGTITFTADGTNVLSATSSQVQSKATTVIDNAKTLQFKELNTNGSDYVGIKPPNTLAASYTLVLPTATGGVGQVLRTNGLGQLEFVDADTFGGNRIYVSTSKGDDANDGTSAPVKTIKRALQLASGLVYTAGGIANGTKIQLIVSAGDYYENNPIIVPDNVSVMGDGLRSTIIRPLNANQDMMRLRTGCYLTNFTFRDGLSSGVPTYTWNYAVAFDDALDTTVSRAGYTYLPTTKPVVQTSPYIQNCSLISFLGGNGALIDGSKVSDPNVPVNQIEVENPVSGFAPPQGKSMVANAFTMISFGGTGWRVINNAYTQLVSCFQIFCLNGVITQSGGYASITNSATNFGLYALRASGYSSSAYDFDKGYVGITGTTGSIQTITAFGWTRVNGPIEQFIIRIYDPITNADLTSSYKTALPAFLQKTFNAATAPNATTNVFTIATHGFNSADNVTYNNTTANPDIGGLYNGDTYFVKYLTVNTFSLCYDIGLTRDVDITSISTGTHNFTKQDYEMCVDNIRETHNSFQTLVLAAGSYSFTVGDAIEGTTAGFPNKAYVYSYDNITRTLVIVLNKVTIGITETRNQFLAGSLITKVGATVVSYTVSTAGSRTDLYAATFEIQPSITGGSFTGVAGLIGKQIFFHRPSITNSSSHTWEYAGAGTDYNALPFNGGKGNPLYEQYRENAGRVYTSGTNELGDFKVGDFITAYNRTGNITFRNKVSVDQLDALRLSLSNVEITAISIDPDLGENESGGPSNSRLSTQKSIWSYANNRLGAFIDQSVSTNAVPGSIVQLNSNGQINTDLIPTQRSFANFSSGGYRSRLTQVDDVPAHDMLAGDIATENFYQIELQLSAPVTAADGTIISQAGTGASGIIKGDFTTATTIIVASATASFIKDAGRFVVGYKYKIESVGTTTFTAIGAAANTVGTIFTATGVGTGTGTASVVFDTTAGNTLTINGDSTPSDSNGTVYCLIVGTSSNASSNYFLRSATSGQYLILENGTSYTFTNATVSKALRYSNTAYITTAAAHGLINGNQVKVDAGTASFDATPYVTVISSTEFSYPNIASNTTATATTTSTATLVGATGTSTTGSVPSGSLTGTIVVGDYVFGATLPYGAKVTVVNMAVNPRTFTIAWPTSATVTGTTTAALTFITPAVETGTVRSVLTAADNNAQGEFTAQRTGVVNSVNNLSITPGSGYSPASGTKVYSSVTLTTSGSGTGALADITVVNGAVTDVDLTYGGTGYAVSDTLSASNVYLGGAGSGFSIPITAVEKRAYVNIFGGQTFIATTGAPDFVEENASTVATLTATTVLDKTFNAQATGAGGDVNTTTNRITITGHTFTSGDPVQYDPGVNSALGGLTTLLVYYVKVIDPNTIELYSTYDLTSIRALSSSTGTHTFHRYAIDLVKNSIVLPAHGYTTGDAFRMTGSDLPYNDGLQISSGQHFFVGSVTTNSFTIHTLRSDALTSIAGITISPSNLSARGTGTITFTKNNVKIIGTVNTSSTTLTNWSSLTASNIDASNIISGVISTTRLASGSASSSTFLRGDSAWTTAVKSVAAAGSSSITVTGGGSSPFYGDIVLDVIKADKTGGAGGYSTTGVVSLNLTQFAVGVGDSISAGQAYIKAGVVDAGTLQTYNAAYFLDPTHLSSAVPVTKGGTALSSYAVGDMIYATGATTLNPLSIGIADSILTSTGSAPQWSTSLTLARNISLTGPDVATTSTSAATLFNTNSPTVSIGNAATNIYIGSNTATQSLTSVVKSYTTSGSASTSVTVSFGLTATIATVSRLTNTTTLTTAANHGLTTGDYVTVVCTSDTSFNATQITVIVTGLTTFTYANSGTNGSSTGGSVYVGATGISLLSGASNGATSLTFTSTTGVRYGQLIQGSASIDAGTYVLGVNATTVYLSAPLSGTITATTGIVFTDTSRSVGINIGDQITIASSGNATLNGTWAITGAGLTSTAVVIKTSATVTATNLARAGTIVKAGTLVLRNRNITIGSSEASASPVAATLKGENNVGTDVAGVNFTVIPGLATGSAASGSFVVQTGAVGSSGAATQTPTTRMTIDGAGLTTFTGDVQMNGDLYVNGTSTSGITNASAVSVKSFALATYRSAKFVLQVTCTAGTDVGAYQVSEVLVIHNGTTATMTDYGVVKTGNSLVTFTADCNTATNGLVRILAQATTGNTITVRAVSQALIL